MLINFQTILAEKKQLTNDQFLFKFNLINPKEISFKAGQYLMLKIDNQCRLYSIYSSEYQKNFVELMIKIIPGGLASNYFNNLKINDQVKFQGPAGVFNLKQNVKDKIFFATFTGLAPLRSMIYSYFFRPQPPQSPKFFLFWGLRNFSDICFLEELKQLAVSNQQFKFYICLSREANLDKIPLEDQKYFKLGRVNTVCEQCNSAIMDQADYYLCASREVVESLNQYLLQKGIAKENIFFEKF